MSTFFFILVSLRAATPWSSSANHMLTVQLLGRLNHHFWNNCLHHHIYHDHTHHLSTYFKGIIAMAVGDIIFSLTLSFAIISNSGSSWTLPSWSRRYVWEGRDKNATGGQICQAEGGKFILWGGKQQTTEMISRGDLLRFVPCVIVWHRKKIFFSLQF